MRVIESVPRAAQPLTLAPAGRRVRARLLGALGVLVAGSLALRLFGLGWGIPAYDPATLADTPFRHSYHLDEDKFLNGLVHMQSAAGNFDVNDYHWGTLQFYLVYGALLGGEAVGVVPAPWEAAFRAGVIPVLPKLYMLGRLVSVFGGVAGTLIVFALAAALAGRAAGFAAGVAYALSPIAVIEAHYLTNDITMSVLAAGAVLAAVLALQRGQVRLLLIAWLLLGLATTAKYPAIAAAPGLLIAQIGLWRAAGSRRGSSLFTYFLLPWLMGGAGFLIGEPYVLILPQKVLQDISWVAQDNVGDPTQATGVLGHVRVLFAQAQAVAKLGLTWPLALLALVGLGLLVWRLLRGPGTVSADPAVPAGANRWAIAVLLVALAGGALGVAANGIPMLRYTQPLIPLLAVAAGVAWAAFPRPAWRALVAVPAVAVAGVITLGQLALLADPHPANELLAWLGTHARPGAFIAQAWSKLPVLDPGRYQVFNMDAFQPHLYAGQHPDYIIMDDLMNPPNAYLARVLANDYREVVHFGAQPHLGPFSWDEGATPHDWKYSHPTFVVYAPK